MCHLRVSLALVAVSLLSALAAAQEAPERVLREIDWSAVPPRAAMQLPSAVLASEAQLRELERATLPVLLPGVQALVSGPAADAAPIVSAAQAAYTVVVPRSDHALILTGSRLAFRVEGLEAPAAVTPPDAEPAVELIEGGLSMSFARYGAYYSLTVECDRLDAPPCANEEYIRDVWRTLRVVAGRPEP